MSYQPGNQSVNQLFRQSAGVSVSQPVNHPASKLLGNQSATNFISSQRVKQSVRKSEKIIKCHKFLLLFLEAFSNSIFLTKNKKHAAFSAPQQQPCRVLHLFSPQLSTVLESNGSSRKDERGSGENALDSHCSADGDQVGVDTKLSP